VELLKIKIESDGGPWCIHDMPCAVCGINHAVYDLSVGKFQPCWDCQKKGFVLVNTKDGSLFMKLFGKILRQPTAASRH